MATNITTNDAGFVTFSSRNWGYAGDKGTWAKLENDKITVKKAARGTISRAYEAELCNFCTQFGQNFDAIPCGSAITFAI